MIKEVNLLEIYNESCFLQKLTLILFVFDKHFSDKNCSYKISIKSNS